MTTSVELVLLKCIKCEMAVEAAEDEVAWACANCGQGLLLEDGGLGPLAVHWAAAAPGSRDFQWHPFWILSGTVAFAKRQTYGRSGQADPLWREPRRFYVPAFPAPLAELERIGGHLTRQQPALPPGPAMGQVQRCTLLPYDARRVAEFIVLTIEAARKDKLRAIGFELLLGAPELWMLPLPRA
jgi:hypothetical protein